MANQRDMISSEEARIMLLEQKNDDFHQTLIRLESILDSMDKKFETKFDGIDKKFDSQNAKIDSHFKWTITLFLGLYGTVVGTLITALGKAYHWF